MDIGYSQYFNTNNEPSRFLDGLDKIKAEINESKFDNLSKLLDITINNENTKKSLLERKNKLVNDSVEYFNSFKQKLDSYDDQTLNEIADKFRNSTILNELTKQHSKEYNQTEYIKNNKQYFEEELSIDYLTLIKLHTYYLDLLTDVANELKKNEEFIKKFIEKFKNFENINESQLKEDVTPYLLIALSIQISSNEVGTLASAVINEESSEKLEVLGQVQKILVKLNRCDLTNESISYAGAIKEILESANKKEVISLDDFKRNAKYYSEDLEGNNFVNTENIDDFLLQDVNRMNVKVKISDDEHKLSNIDDIQNSGIDDKYLIISPQGTLRVLNGYLTTMLQDNLKENHIYNLSEGEEVKNNFLLYKDEEEYLAKGTFNVNKINELNLSTNSKQELNFNTIAPSAIYKFDENDNKWVFDHLELPDKELDSFWYDLFMDENKALAYLVKQGILDTNNIKEDVLVNIIKNDLLNISDVKQEQVSSLIIKELINIEDNELVSLLNKSLINDEALAHLIKKNHIKVSNLNQEHVSSLIIKKLINIEDNELVYLLNKGLINDDAIKSRTNLLFNDQFNPDYKQIESLKDVNKLKIYPKNELHLYLFHNEILNKEQLPGLPNWKKSLANEGKERQLQSYLFGIGLLSDRPKNIDKRYLRLGQAQKTQYLLREHEKTQSNKVSPHKTSINNWNKTLNKWNKTNQKDMDLLQMRLSKVNTLKRIASPFIKTAVILSATVAALGGLALAATSVMVAIASFGGSTLLSTIGIAIGVNAFVGGFAIASACAFSVLGIGSAGIALASATSLTKSTHAFFTRDRNRQKEIVEIEEALNKLENEDNSTEQPRQSRSQ